MLPRMTDFAMSATNAFRLGVADDYRDYCRIAGNRPESPPPPPSLYGTAMLSRMTDFAIPATNALRVANATTAVPIDRRLHLPPFTIRGRPLTNSDRTITPIN